jgi:hypothetical protein
MTYPGEQPTHQVWAAQQATTSAPQPPAQRRAWLPWTIAGLALLAVAVGVVVLLAGSISAGGDLSREVAQRECRTALEHEATRRANNLDPGGTTSIVATVKRVDLQETFETDAGWTVNGTVAYTLTSGLVPQVEQSVSLSCTAAGTDAAVTTAVVNR